METDTLDTEAKSMDTGMCGDKPQKICVVTPSPAQNTKEDGEMAVKVDVIQRWYIYYYSLMWYKGDTFIIIHWCDTKVIHLLLFWCDTKVIHLLLFIDVIQRWYIYYYSDVIQRWYIYYYSLMWYHIIIHYYAHIFYVIRYVLLKLGHPWPYMSSPRDPQNVNTIHYAIHLYWMRT